MDPQSPDQRPASEFGDADLESVFSTGSPADTCAAVLTEARIVLPDLATALDAELWGSDVVGALGTRSSLTQAMVVAAEREGSKEALAVLRVLAAVGPPDLRAGARAAGDRLAGHGTPEPAWAAVIGAPAVTECWRYRDARGLQEAVTMGFSYGLRQHVVSVLVDNSQGGAIQDVWIGADTDALEWTRQMSARDPEMIFEMISPQAARALVSQAIAAGEGPRQPAEASNVASRRALLRARVDLLPAGPPG
jgi:hypothetical protein